MLYSFFQDKLLTFRVDPNLTSEQVDEVQKVILKKVPLKVSFLPNSVVDLMIFLKSFSNFKFNPAWITVMRLAALA